MKESTRKAIDWATEVIEAAGLKMTEAGFKYHSERFWVAFTESADSIWLMIPADGKDPEMKIYRGEYAEDFGGKEEPAPKKKKKKVKS